MCVCVCVCVCLCVWMVCDDHFPALAFLFLYQCCAGEVSPASQTGKSRNMCNMNDMCLVVKYLVFYDSLYSRVFHVPFAMCNFLLGWF